MTDIRPIFERLNLASYVQVFRENGFEYWEDVLNIAESDFQDLGVKIGHRRRLQGEIANYKRLTTDHLRPSTERGHSTETMQNGEDEDEEPVNMGGGADNRGPTGKRRYRRHPKPDKNAPERPPSAYVLFSNQVREELRSRNLSFTEIAKAVGERWQRLDAKGREPYETEAGLKKDDYNAKSAEYRRTDSYKEYSEYLVKFKAEQGEGKRIKLERSTGSTDDSSRETADAAATSSHGSPLASAIPVPPRSEATNSTLSSPTGSIGTPSYRLQANMQGDRMLLPSRPSTTIPPPSEHATLPPIATSSPRPMSSRRSNARPPPFIRKRDAQDVVGSSQSYSSSHHSQDHSPHSVHSPGLAGSQGLQTPTFAAHGMQRLLLASSHPDYSNISPVAAGLNNPSPLQPAFPAPEIASRTLPPPMPSGFANQQSAPRYDGISILALAGRMVDGDLSKPPTPKPN